MITDVVSAFGAVYLLWEQYLIIGVCIAFIPSTVLSMVLIAKVDLEKYKNSAFGVYIRKHMSSKAHDWLRFAGLMVMMVGTVCVDEGLATSEFRSKREASTALRRISP
jgi:hypothetical protein